MRVLYEADIAGHPWREALRHQAEELQVAELSVSMAEQCVAGVLDHRQELDQLIHRHAPAWPVAQLSIVDRNILRLALYELGHMAETPAKVAISEAVALAKQYGGEGSPRFINGVLGAVWAEQQAADAADKVTSDPDQPGG